MSALSMKRKVRATDPRGRVLITRDGTMPGLEAIQTCRETFENADLPTEIQLIWDKLDFMLVSAIRSAVECDLAEPIACQIRGLEGDVVLAARQVVNRINLQEGWEAHLELEAQATAELDEMYTLYVGVASAAATATAAKRPRLQSPNDSSSPEEESEPSGHIAHQQ